MDYKDYRVNDFLQNEFFVDWVLRPNPESDHFWINWINVHPEKRGEVEMARELVKSLNYNNPQRLDTDEYSHLLEKILQHKEPKKFTRLLHISQLDVLKIAASVALLVSLAASYYYLSENLSTPKPDAVTHVTWEMSSTEYGQKKTIQLSDGTKVILNSGSRIEYPNQFLSDQRKVRFHGEAFFEVAHNPQKPFFIESGSITTRVLGTSFNLKSFEEEEEVSVSVVSGKVEIKAETGETALLLPNDMGVFNKKEKNITRRGFDREKLLAWTSGTLIFENEDLPTIFTILEKWYGVEIHIEEGVNLQGRYSGEYKRKSLELVLEGLSYTSNFKYTINHKTIKIYEEKLTEM